MRGRMFRPALLSIALLLTSEAYAQTPPTIPASGAPGLDFLASALAKTDEASFSRKLDQELEAAADKRLFSGVVVIAKGNRIFFNKAYGIADRDHDVPNRPDTRFNLASASKMFTSVAIAQLVERGKLRYDDPLSAYLDSSWLAPQYLSKIRIAHLLTHTSGLTSYFTPSFMRSSRSLYKSIADYKPLISDAVPIFEPGTGWAYSNVGFLLLGAVIEKVSGVSYFDYVRDNVLKPAGMNDTDALDLEYVNKNIATGYAKVPNDAPEGALPGVGAPPPGPPPGPQPPPPRLIDVAMHASSAEEQIEAKGGYRWRNNIFAHVVKGGPAGGYYTTGQDLVRFFDALRSGKLVKPDTLRLLTTPKPQSPGYGYGFQLEDGAFGHTGGFLGISTMAFALPQDISFIVLSNVSTQGFTPLVKALALLR